ncbi:MAG: phosphonate C-P lyase system protein PhnG [Polaromonas sp.]|uniref:phosphonate C-P lyase system protein PhnG n=1 Tax=Polaromonas sp. TaxID=1869339 RepID=UPI0027347D5F|nr:phosphonate C-P lyase system protein PhnG [Polaromonas sp.]MDP2817825.1 phosphonate C-P lyase system protein PhnG [Polaromonas sp.]
MTNRAIDENQRVRKHWLGVLSRAGRAELEQALMALADLPPIEHVRPPEPGMVMLRGRVGGTGDAFNLGEATVTRCALRVGTGALGVGYTLGRDRRKAELVALFDALLQDETRKAQLLRELITPLQQGQAAGREATSRSAAASKVEFFTFVRGEA